MPKGGGPSFFLGQPQLGFPCNPFPRLGIFSSALGLLLVLKSEFRVEFGPHLDLFFQKDQQEGEACENDRHPPNVFQTLRVGTDNLSLDGFGERVE